MEIKFVRRIAGYISLYTKNILKEMGVESVENKIYK